MKIVVRPVKSKTYLGRKAFAAISDVVKLAGGHFFSAGKASKFIIPKSWSEQAYGLFRSDWRRYLILETYGTDSKK